MFHFVCIIPSMVAAAYVTVTGTAHHVFPCTAAILHDSGTSQTCCMGFYCTDMLVSGDMSEGQGRARGRGEQDR